MSGWFYLALGALVTVADFAVGLYMFRRGDGAATLYADGMPLEADANRRFGRMIMLISPIFLIVLGLLAFGLIPIEGIEPISLGGGQ